MAKNHVLPIPDKQLFVPIGTGCCAKPRIKYGAKYSKKYPFYSSLNSTALHLTFNNFSFQIVMYVIGSPHSTFVEDATKVPPVQHADNYLQKALKPIIRNCLNLGYANRLDHL